MNFHDLYNRGGAEAGTEFFRTLYDALKPGGVLGVIDHAGSAGQDNASFHRVDVGATKRALESAGFTIAAESDLLANPDDDHRVGIQDESLNGKTDRFLIRARKPM
jgi:predicted methyltransferase